MAMKVVRQARLELSGGSTPDQLRPPGNVGEPETSDMGGGYDSLPSLCTSPFDQRLQWVYGPVGKVR